MKELSILIPTFNDECVLLVSQLQQQAEVARIVYEILVADDGSTQKDIIDANRAINSLPHCQYLEQPQNMGRAAIRNYLTKQAQYPWLLFIDSDMIVRHQDYLQQYIQTSENAELVYGGVSIGEGPENCLRAIYEKAMAHEHTLERRREQPYQDFHTANFLISKQLMMQHPFNERFRYYGYEDVLLGKELQEADIMIHHIDNPLSFERFETNDSFVSKTEEGLRTLKTFHAELFDYSRLLQAARHYAWLMPLMRLVYRSLGRRLRDQLTGSRPNLLIFKLYKMAYFAALWKQ